jgi:hypothetical protein
MNDTNCSALNDCLANCAAGDQTCVNNCASMHQSGVQLFINVQKCVFCTACKADCSSVGASCP